jgi:hypothetical protein
MSMDYKIKKYNYKIIEAIKNNKNYKIPDYLQHTSFYIKEFLSNSFKGGKPQPADRGLNPARIGTTLEEAADRLTQAGLRLRAARALNDGDKDGQIANLRAELQGVRDEQDAINERMRVLQLDRDRIQDEKNVLETDRNRFQAENVTSAEAIRTKDLRLAEINQQLAEINQQLQECTARREQLTLENQNLTDRINVLTAANAYLTAANVNLTGQTVELNRRLTETQYSRQENYNAGLKEIREFRKITLQLNDLLGEDILDFYHFNDQQNLIEHYGLTPAAAAYILSEDANPPFPELAPIL